MCFCSQRFKGEAVALLQMPTKKMRALNLGERVMRDVWCDV